MKRLTLLAALLPLPAFAHVGDGLHHGLAAGFAHPLTGLDHLLAMVMVGLWAGLVGGRARWALPLAFLGAMAAGSALGAAGIGLPGVEAGILASVIILGAVVALAVRLPLAVATGVAALFGLLHGNAHGLELPGGAALLGMLAATALLHGLGLALALPAAPVARQAARLAGAGAATAGIALTLLG